MVHLVLSRQIRAARLGRTDGTSRRGNYVVRWVDEDTGQHEARVKAASREDALAEVAGLVGNNTVQVFGPVHV